MTYGKKSLSCLYTLALSASFLISCAPKAADKIGDAQLCLDKATQGTAAACLEKIEGIDTAAANVMRCSAGFIDEGFTDPTRFKKAFDALSQKSAGATNTLTFLSFIAFSSKGTATENKAFATDTYNSCLKTKAKGLTLLGSMAMTATVISGGLTALNDGAAIQTAITSLLGSADDSSKTAVGSAVIATYTSSCTDGSEANQGLCDQLNGYLGTDGAVDISDPLAVGNAILTNWNGLTPAPVP
ncbi:MAG TPA: hypothetical protein VIG33_14185 [Pseudobdellovibrionaceae bacterium]|jgi:hypothetical protein